MTDDTILKMRTWLFWAEIQKSALVLKKVKTEMYDKVVSRKLSKIRLIKFSILGGNIRVQAG